MMSVKSIYFDKSLFIKATDQSGTLNASIIPVSAVLKDKTSFQNPAYNNQWDTIEGDQKVEIASLAKNSDGQLCFTLTSNTSIKSAIYPSWSDNNILWPVTDFKDIKFE